MKETIKREASAVIGVCRMQSVIRNIAEPDPLVLCPSHRQSYPFNSLWLSITCKQKNIDNFIEGCVCLRLFRER